jgi:hypothetical protein
MSEPFDLLALVTRQDESDGIAPRERVTITDDQLVRLWEAWDEADEANHYAWDALQFVDGGTITTTVVAVDVNDQGDFDTLFQVVGGDSVYHAAATLAALAKTAFVPLLRRLAIAEATVRDLCEDGREVQAFRELRRQNDVMRAALETIRASYTTSAVAYRISQAALVEANREPE